MSINAEDLMLAHAVKTERTAIPVNITVAVEQNRINPDDFVDNSLKDVEDDLKSDQLSAKAKYQKAKDEEKKAKLKMKRRDAIKNGTIKPTKKSDLGSFYLPLSTKSSGLILLLDYISKFFGSFLAHFGTHLKIRW